MRQQQQQQPQKNERECKNGNQTTIFWFWVFFSSLLLPIAKLIEIGKWKDTRDYMKKLNPNNFIFFFSFFFVNFISWPIYLDWEMLPATATSAAAAAAECK